jgi:threonine aldolase
MPEQLVGKLHQRGWRFYKFIEPDIYRLMCAWSVTEREIEEFVDDARNSVAAIRMADKGIA